MIEMMKHIILSMILFVCATAMGQARDITGQIVGPDNRPVAEATVIASVKDSIISMQISDKNGMVTIQYEGEDTVDVDVQATGFESKGVSVESGAVRFTVQLEKAEKSTDLKEAVVQVDKSETMTPLANGYRFFLSSKAKARKDPFMALKEIPMLISDPFNATVKTVKGSAPLVLINGIELNSGIKPILPADIEYVEVIDAVPARYMARGVTSILNIKLRDNRPPYVWTELATRHDFPIRNGFGVGYFEVGTEKFSIYGRTFMEYKHHDDSEGSVQQSNTGYTQDYEWHKRNNNYRYLGELQLKYAPNAKNYFALQLYEMNSKGYTKTTGHGTFESDGVTGNEYTKYSADKDRSSIFTSSAYYKHVFSDAEELQITAAYNNNHNRLVTDGYEHFGERPFNTSSLFQNKRNSGNVNIHYLKCLKNGDYLSAGATTAFQKDRILRQPQSAFNYNKYGTFVYGSYTGRVKKKLNYMASAGVMPRWINGNNITSYHCVNPYVSASLSYPLNQYHSLSTSYSLTSQTPEAENLNPYNTSTDSLFATVGNPDLVPQKNQSLNLTYSFYKKRFYLSLSTGANLNTDLIQAYGFTDEKGVYTSTYKNTGRFRSWNSSLDMNYRLGSDNYNANLRFGVGHSRLLYDGHSPKDCYALSFSVNADLKKFFVGMDMSYSPKTYTDITTTRNLRPTWASVQVNYRFSENLYIAVCLQGFAGNQKTKVMTSDGTFKSVSLTKLTETGFHPWVLVRWNMRKNTKRKIKLGNVLNSNESGIKLK